MIEALESRVHLAATAAIKDNVLVVTGTGKADLIQVSGGGAIADDKLFVLIDNTKAYKFRDSVKSIRILGKGGDDIISCATITLGFKMKAKIVAGAGDDGVHGTSGNDTISGGTGNDTLHGLSGKDTINGNKGKDTIYGGPDKDAIDGGAGKDTIQPEAAPPPTARSGGPGSLPDEMEFLLSTRRSITTLTVIGGSAMNFVSIEETDDEQIRVSGDAVANTYDPDEIDRIVVKGKGGDDIISAHGFKVDDIDLVLKGGPGADSIRGGGGPDTLKGGRGDDTLIGNAGKDKLAGGAGENELFNGRQTFPGAKPKVFGFDVDDEDDEDDDETVMISSM